MRVGEIIRPGDSNHLALLNKTQTVKKNDWVRMTRGHFKGDLALVKHVRPDGLKCVIQCVPRLDLSLSDLPPEEAKVRRRTVKPPQKFFNAQEVASMGKHLLRQRFPGFMFLVCLQGAGRGRRHVIWTFEIDQNGIEIGVGTSWLVQKSEFA